MSTITQIINGHLNKLKEATKFGVTNYKKLDLQVRDSFSLIKKNVKMEAVGWNVVLKSPTLINFFNTHDLSNEDIEVVETVLLVEERSTQEIEQALIAGNVTYAQWSMYSSEVYSNLAENYSSYSVSHAIKGSFKQKIFIDLINYLNKNQLEFEMNQIIEITKRLVSLLDKRNEIEAYNSSLSFDERMAFIDYRMKYMHSDLVYSPVTHFLENEEHLELCEKLYEVTIEKESTWSRADYMNAWEPILDFINNSSNKERAKEWITKIFKHPKCDEWLRQFFLWEKHGERMIQEHEIRKLAEADYTDERPVYEIIYGSDSDMEKLLSNHASINNAIVRNQVKEWFKTKKKGIIRLFATNPSFYMSSHGNSVLYSSVFQSIVNVNTLNEDNVKKLLKNYLVSLVEKHLLSDVTLTFNEFDYLYQEVDEINRAVFYKLVEMNVPIDKRLRLIKELPPLRDFKGMFTNEEMIEKVSDLLIQKPLKTWFENHPIQLLQNVRSKHKLFVLLAPEMYKRFKKEIRMVSDLDFVMKNYTLLKSASSLNEAKGKFIQENGQAIRVFNDLGLSDEFIEMYRDNIIYFFDRDLGTVYLKLANSSKLSTEQKHNLRLLTKAELANKLDEIKFVDEDFELEIGLPLTEVQKANWKFNKQTKVQKMTISETYDYDTTIRIGENPVRSCLHWDEGQYSRCLLSLFDTNKKILIAKDEKGRIMARAALRLIKGSSDERVYNINKEKTFSNKALAFKDIEGNTPTKVDTDNPETINEELVLFLENVYSPLNFQECAMVKQAFIRLMEEKAAEMGAKLVMSTNYNDNVSSEQYINEAYHLFISYSKNGYQYLDSLTGQAAEALEGSYRTAHMLTAREPEEVNEEEKIAVNQ